MTEHGRSSPSHHANYNSMRMDYCGGSSDNNNKKKDGLMMDDLDDHDNNTKIQEDSHTKSLIKGITWRFLATSTTTLIAWLVIGEVEAALQIGVTEFFAKLIIYYIHERIWTRVRCI